MDIVRIKIAYFHIAELNGNVNTSKYYFNLRSHCKNILHLTFYKFYLYIYMKYEVRLWEMVKVKHRQKKTSAMICAIDVYAFVYNPRLNTFNNRNASSQYFDEL